MMTPGKNIRNATPLTKNITTQMKEQMLIMIDNDTNIVPETTQMISKQTVMTALQAAKEMPVTLSQAMVAYIEYLQHEQHASDTTRLGYGSWLRRFRRFLVERHGDEPALGAISSDDVR